MSDKLTDFIALDAGFGNTRLYGPKGSVVLHSLVATNGTQAVSQWAAGGLKRASQAKDQAAVDPHRTWATTTSAPARTRWGGPSRISTSIA